MVKGDVANGFMFCLMWSDRQSEERYKSENEHWKVLMRDLKGLGMLSEEEFHGKAYQVLGEGQRKRYEFLNDSSDGYVEMSEKLESMRKQSNERAGTHDQEVKLEKTTSHWNSTEEESPGARTSDRIDLLRSPKISKSATKEESCITSWWADWGQQTAEVDSNDESCLSTPILTPSSSTMSLNSLPDESNPLIELPGTWKSKCNIPRSKEKATQVHSPMSAPLVPDVRITQSPSHLPTYQLRRASSSQSSTSSDLPQEAPEDQKSGLGTQAWSPTKEPPNAPASMIEQQRAIEKSRESISHPPCTAEDRDPMARDRIPQWDPDLELANAKSRFWRRRKAFVAPQLARQQVALRGRWNPPSSTAERAASIGADLTINPLRNVRADHKEKRSGSWWACLIAGLSSPAASKARSDAEASGAVDSVHGKEDAAQKIASNSTSNSSLE
jgi:hypothetical protein